MLMPSKHINFSQSLLGFGSYLLTKLSSPKSVDDLWKEYQDDLIKDIYSSKHSFDNLVLTLIFLFAAHAIEEKKGVLYRCG
jgi:hypothetical protein